MCNEAKKFAGVCIAGRPPWAGTSVGVRRHPSARAPRCATGVPGPSFTQEHEQRLGERVSAPSSEWEEVSAGLNSAPCAVWSVPKLSPWKQSTSHQLVVGTFKGARVGLWLGEFQLSGDQLTGIFSL